MVTTAATDDAETLDGKCCILTNTTGRLSVGGVGQLISAAVLDLPQLYTRPSAATLLNVLEDLTSEPPSWDSAPPSPSHPSALTSHRKRIVQSEGLASYLTKIVSSPLAWIEDEVQKELVWEAASRRLTERSGRSAMAALSRTFFIPLHTTTSSIGHSSGNASCHAATTIRSGEPMISLGSVQFTLHEPALTADNLGLKTWASSYLLARRMFALRRSLPALPEASMILELGSGTGLVGLAAAAVFGAHVVLTDLPEIVPNLERNVQSNTPIIVDCGAKASVAVLDWSKPRAFHLNGVHHGDTSQFALIFAADPIYSSDHPGLLAQAISHHLSRTDDARVVVEMPLREAYISERLDFTAKMSAIGLTVTDEGEETGVDDWSSSHDGELTEVRCWWSVWAWR